MGTTLVDRKTAILHCVHERNVASESNNTAEVTKHVYIKLFTHIL